jgi:pimeloyl-ACP methyl ester carboxylesterase
MEFTIKEYKSPVKVYHYPGNTLFIYFQYNLVDPTKLKKNNHIILIDRFKKFFLAGIDGYFENFRDLLYWLKSQIEKLAPKKIVVIGCSLGGFSAILFGHLLNAQFVYSFGATTCLDAKKLANWGDTRYKLERDLLIIDALNNSSSKILQYMDLANLDLDESVTQIMLFFSIKIPVDIRHARNISSHKKVIEKPVMTQKDDHIANITEILPLIIKQHSK